MHLQPCLSHTCAGHVGRIEASISVQQATDIRRNSRTDVVHEQNCCAIIHPTLGAADHTYTHIAYSQTQVRKCALHILIAHRPEEQHEYSSRHLPRVPGSSSAILDTDLGTRSAQVPRPAVAERKPLVLPQLLFPRHPARPNVLARLPPLAQGSGHASTPRLLDQGPHRTAKLAVSRPCGWRLAGVAQATGGPSQQTALVRAPASSPQHAPVQRRVAQRS